MQSHDQLRMTPREMAGIRRVATIVAMIYRYIRYCNEARYPIHAPKDDTDFLKDIRGHEDQEVAAAADRAVSSLVTSGTRVRWRGAYWSLFVR